MDKYEDILDCSILKKTVIFMLGEYKHYCWKYKEAVDVVNIMCNKGYVTSGGDVLKEIDGKITHIYDNWHYDIDVNLENRQLIDESMEKALDYLKQCYGRYEDEAIYLLVYRNIKEVELR